MKIKIGLIIIAFVSLTSVIQYYFGPKKVVTKVKEVVKIQEVVVRDIEIVETRDGKKVTRIKERKKTDTDQRKQSQRTVSPKNKDWLVGVQYGLSQNNLYGLNISRRILGDIYVGISIDTNKQVGASVTFRF